MPKGIYERKPGYRAHLRIPARDRFWAKVDKSGDCWEWTGSRHPRGYGRFRIKTGETNVMAHRFSYELAFGPIPDGMHVLHKCDNQPCVNPDHLELGTHQKNMHDAMIRGQHSKKLGKIVTDVRTMYNKGWRQQQIAKYFGVSQSAVSNLVNGKNYGWVK